MPATIERPPFKPSWSDWCPPAEWTCPSCGAVTVTREPDPRCPACGFHDSGH